MFDQIVDFEVASSMVRRVGFSFDWWFSFTSNGKVAGVPELQSCLRDEDEHVITYIAGGVYRSDLARLLWTLRKLSQVR